MISSQGQPTYVDARM